MRFMTSFVNSLKSEIARVARKELKQELLTLRKASAAHRSEIAALKRQIKSLATALRTVSKASRGLTKDVPSAERNDLRAGFRFSANRLIALREKVGITQAQMASLLGVSYQSVHKWEKGDAKPRAAQLQGIASVAKMGKREIQKKLEE